MSQPKHKVLFLCTGNSCRSQMAEAIVNAKIADSWQAFSAGIEPAGFVHPMAITALKEIGVEHQGTSKPLGVFRDQKFDVVVTVCEPAAANCPVWLKEGKVIHFPLQDPAKAEGTDEEKMLVFRRVRDLIAHDIPEILESSVPGNLS